LLTVLLLAGSMIFVLGAFATAYYVELPPILKYRHSMIISFVLGGSVCAVTLGVFLTCLIGGGTKQRELWVMKVQTLMEN
jgi:hypothetical protein